MKDVESLALPALRQIKRLEVITRRTATAASLGEFRSSFRGHGLTFSDLRDYIPGDDIKRIHWKASARTGRTYVKNFEEERQLRIHVAVDCSKSLVGGEKKSALSSVIETAALLCAFGVLNRDVVSLSLFGDSAIDFVPPGTSRFHLKRLFGSLVSPKEISVRTNIAGHLDSLSKNLNSGTILFILSDFLAPPFYSALSQVSRKSEVCAIQYRAFEDLPRSGIILFEDPETGKKLEIDTSYIPARKKIAETLKKHELELRNLFRKVKGDHVVFHKDPLHTVQALSRMRRARIR